MCIAIFKPHGVKLEKSVLQKCFDNNKDGCGFAYHESENNRIIVKKGYSKFDDFWANFYRHMNRKMIIHFRNATHGEVDFENCHPFFVNENLVFAHNGMIIKINRWDLKKSDSWHFNEAILRGIVEKFPEIWKSAQFRVLVEFYIGKSRLIFMDNKGDVAIFNKELGVEEFGCWFSNNYYKVDRATEYGYYDEEYYLNWMKAYNAERFGIDDLDVDKRGNGREHLALPPPANSAPWSPKPKPSVREVSRTKVGDLLRELFEECAKDEASAKEASEELIPYSLVPYSH
jgi:predicted glutamine amidotransferase